MAVKTKAQILSEISSLLADNTTGDISAQDVRTVVNDITDSYEDLITAGTTSQYWRGDKSWQTLPILEATGSLSSAQINALDTTPIQLIAAPGANKFYVIENTTFHYKAGTTGFTVSNSIDLRYSTADEKILEPILDTILQGTISKIYIAAFQDSYFSTAIINDAIKILAVNSISGGNGSINYSIKYRIVTTS